MLKQKLREQESVKNSKPQVCACGCEEKVGPQSFYVKTPDGKFLATRSCYEKYKESNEIVYASPNLAT